MSELTTKPLTPGKLYKCLTMLSSYYAKSGSNKMLDCPSFLLIDITADTHNNDKFFLTILVGKQTYNINLWKDSIDRFIRSIP